MTVPAVADEVAAAATVGQRRTFSEVVYLTGLRSWVQTDPPQVREMVAFALSYLLAVWSVLQDRTENRHVHGHAQWHAILENLVKYW